MLIYQRVNIQKTQGFDQVLTIHLGPSMSGTLKTRGAATHLARFGSRHFGSAEAQAQLMGSTPLGWPLGEGIPHFLMENIIEYPILSHIVLIICI
jgi:hypothetical protein